MEPEQMDRIYEHVKARQFELGALLPISWKSASLDLKHAADRLYDLYHDGTQRQIARVVKEAKKKGKSEGSRTLKGKELEDFQDSKLITTYYLLVGYAIENLLKAILFIEHPEYFRTDAKMTEIRSHDLVNLCKRCGISVQQDEVDLLGRLTTYVEWMGKYPIPLEAETMWPIRQNDGTWKSRGESFRGRQQQKELDRLYARIWGALEAKRKPSAESASYD